MTVIFYHFNLSKMIYSLIYKLNNGDLFHYICISSVRNILNSAGLSGIWKNQSLPELPDHLNKKKVNVA